MAKNTFNLSEFHRQMGMKNPVPNVGDTVFPVVVVGDFSNLTPKHQPPTGFFGGSLPAVAAQFTVIQIRSRALGGTNFQMWSTAQNIKFGLFPTAIAGLTVFPDRGPLSNEASVVVVEGGSVAVDPTAGDDFPVVRAPQQPFAFYIPTGANLVLVALVANQAIDNWAVILEDIIPSELTQ